ncbi:hypothetical protein AB182_17150 [Phytobacter ursingii]|uniref:Uncharacterized protein n=1 Tax=Phytobacter ursingii TaxID=1972431 RepID=A0AAC8QQX5_9ENTR|nr:hypothetical protein AB182_17150 [Phytobacter ursingii]
MCSPWRKGQNLPDSAWRGGEVRFCEPQFVQGCAKIKLAVQKVNTCYRVVLGGRLQIKQISENYGRAIRK